MVAMNTPAKLPLLMVDAIGGAVLGAIVVGCAYLVFFHADHATVEINELTSLINSASEDLSMVRTARDRQRAILKEQHGELESSRQLPADIPIEEYLQALSGLAAQNRLRVVRQNPLPSREYPGLLEQRYAYEVSGSVPDMARFFKAVEDADFWADIAYLKVDGAQAETNNRDRLALLTISLFSAVKQEPAAEGG